jgi:cyclopropane-fatty-acyl-phospholipid synthase
MIKQVIGAMERGWIPDPVIRAGIRKLCKDRLRSLEPASSADYEKAAREYVEALKRSPLVIHAKEANDQHYELPPEFFALTLGKNRKYSSAFYATPETTLDEAEDYALAETMARAELKDGMEILELGCGWGSLTLAMARKFPNARITALSNSAPQRGFIETQLAQENLTNVQILTRNIDDVVQIGDGTKRFDRVVSVEMFEHLRNYQLILERVNGWLKNDGKLFVHIFTHRRFSYYFETEGEDNWMGRYFFTGGQMPSEGLLASFQAGLALQRQWRWSGTHYSRTSEDWLKNMDRNRDAILEIFSKTYGPKEAAIWFERWRIFFLSCAELFGFERGSEWGVTHYLFAKQSN